jgi:hypothetical protein
MSSYSPLRLKRRVAENSKVGPEDVLNTKRALHELGYYEVPEHGLTSYPSLLMFEAIAQVQRKHNLSRDAKINPGGETQAAINRELGQRAALSAKEPITFGPAPGQDKSEPTLAEIDPGQEVGPRARITAIKKGLADLRARIERVKGLIDSEIDPARIKRLERQLEIFKAMKNNYIDELMRLEGDYLR